MRMLASLALICTTLAAQAQTCRPAADEVARAAAACAAEVTQTCLYTLAIDAALMDAARDESASLLNDIAVGQATSGDAEGAARTLLLTTPNFFGLAAVGRTEEAIDALAAVMEDAGFKTMEVDPPDIGDQKLSETNQFLAVGDPDRALSTALSIPINDEGAQYDALRAIIHHYLIRQDFAAAARIVPQIISYYGREGALLAVVDSWSTSGETTDVIAFIDQFADPQGQTRARLVLMKALIVQGDVDAAKVQLDLIFTTVVAAEPPPAFGLEVLSTSADLALRASESNIAEQHAEAAFRLYGRPRVFRGAEDRPDEPSRIDLLRLGTVLHLLGQTGKASTLLAKASEPYPESLLSNLRPAHLAALLVAQIRINDRDAADATIQQLLAMDESLVKGTTVLHHAAMELVELGFLQDAVQIAMFLEDRLGDDLIFVIDEDPALLYAAIVTKDPSLASELMTDTLGTRVHFRLLLALARALQAKGETAQAQAVLSSLADNHKMRDEADTGFDGDPICAGVAIALTQDSLGFAEAAAFTRQQGLALADAATDPATRAADLIALGVSFPASVKARDDQRNRGVQTPAVEHGIPESTANSILHGLRCLAYL